MNRLVILDRDGVINEDSLDYVKSPDEWRPIEGSLEAIARLAQTGYQVVVATNQSGIARGLYTIDDMHAMHDKMHEMLAGFGVRIDGVFFCPHGPDDGCDCRKPKSGLFREIARRYGRTDLADVPVIGDSARDLEAGIALGGAPWLVLTGKGVDTFRHAALPPATRVRPNLAAVARELAASR